MIQRLADLAGMQIYIRFLFIYVFVYTQIYNIYDHIHINMYTSFVYYILYICKYIYKWSSAYNGVQFNDFSILWLCKGNMHLLETVRWILILDPLLGWDVHVGRDCLVIVGRGSQPHGHQSERPIHLQPFCAQAAYVFKSQHSMQYISWDIQHSKLGVVLDDLPSCRLM